MGASVRRRHCSYSSRGGGYLNYMGSDEPLERVQAAFGAEKFARLRELKRKFDPDKVFSHYQNMPPLILAESARLDDDQHPDGAADREADSSCALELDRTQRAPAHDVAPARQRGSVDERQAAIVRVQARAGELELALEILGAPGGGCVDLRVAQFVEIDADVAARPSTPIASSSTAGRGCAKNPTDAPANVGTNAISLKRMSVSERSSCVVCS